MQLIALMPAFVLLDVLTFIRILCIVLSQVHRPKYTKL